MFLERLAARSATCFLKKLAHHCVHHTVCAEVQPQSSMLLLFSHYNDTLLHIPVFARMAVVSEFLQTPVAVRFSTVTHERGSPEASHLPLPASVRNPLAVASVAIFTKFVSLGR